MVPTARVLDGSQLLGDGGPLHCGLLPVVDGRAGVGSGWDGFVQNRLHHQGQLWGLLSSPRVPSLLLCSPHTVHLTARRHFLPAASRPLASLPRPLATTGVSVSGNLLTLMHGVSVVTQCAGLCVFWPLSLRVGLPSLSVSLCQSVVCFYGR